MPMLNDVKISSPWIIHYRKIEAMFEKDPDVTVVFDDSDDKYRIKVFVNNEDNEKKAAYIQALLIPEVVFGNVTVYVEVIPCNRKGRCKTGSVDIDIYALDEIFEIALSGNTAFNYIDIVDGVFENPIVYVVFAKKVVQYFTDDIGDAHGVCSTLYQDIAKDIFVPISVIHYCTNATGGF